MKGFLLSLCQHDCSTQRTTRRCPVLFDQNHFLGIVQIVAHDEVRSNLNQFGPMKRSPNGLSIASSPRTV